MVGTVSRTAKVSGATRNLKEAAGKVPARRTGIAYEAATSGRGGQEIQSPIAIRKMWKYMRRVYGMKVTRLTLGGLSACLVLPASRDVGMGWQKSAEGIVGSLDRAKGPNRNYGQELEFR